MICLTRCRIGSALVPLVIHRSPPSRRSTGDEIDVGAGSNDGFRQSSLGLVHKHGVLLTKSSDGPFERVLQATSCCTSCTWLCDWAFSVSSIADLYDIFRTSRGYLRLVVELPRCWAPSRLTARTSGRQSRVTPMDVAEGWYLWNAMLTALHAFHGAVDHSSSTAFA